MISSYGAAVVEAVLGMMGDALGRMDVTQHTLYLWLQLLLVITSQVPNSYLAANA